MNHYYRDDDFFQYITLPLWPTKLCPRLSDACPETDELKIRDATTRHQTVERRHVSLLFEKKEAQQLDRESAYKIGTFSLRTALSIILSISVLSCAGLQKLKQLDSIFDEENDLFDESRIHFQRSMITKEENSVLNEKIERFLFQLSPYMQHFACHQVLEWLVYRYQVKSCNTHSTVVCCSIWAVFQIYAYNAEAMIVTFLPFHETNIFGHMLSIIDYNFSTSKDWGFLESFRKKEYPVPFSAFAGEEFLEKKCYMLFTFYAKLLIAVLDDSTKINDVLLAKIIPLIALGLKSSLPSFRQVSLMVVCKMAVSTKLTPDVSASLAKILIMVVSHVDERKKRTRRRSDSVCRRASTSPPAERPAKKKSALERAEELASSSEFSRRQEFVGDPIKNARKWIKMEMWDNVSSASNFSSTWSYFNVKVAWAFDVMTTRSSYFAQKLEDEVETFVVEVIQMTIGSKKCPVISQARLAFAEVNFRPDFIVALLSNHEGCESLPKKPRSVNVPDVVSKVLLDNKLSCAGKDTLAMQTVVLLLKMIKSPGKYAVTCADLNMDVVLEMMRTTHNHHILRESLRLLTAAVKLSPANVTSHVMSIFTFMGSGLLRKDNELTLGIIEDTVEALFGAICAQDGRTLPSEMQLRLVDVSRVFAASVCDIPAHRRTRMANAITRAVKHINVFCARWQRAAVDASKRSADQDAFEDLALELCVGLDPVHQVGNLGFILWYLLQFCVVADIVDFIIRLRGDSSPLESQGRPLDQAVFDRLIFPIVNTFVDYRISFRSKYSLPKLRHFRFVMIGLVYLCSLTGNVECFYFSSKETLPCNLLISEVLDQSEQYLPVFSSKTFIFFHIRCEFEWAEVREYGSRLLPPERKHAILQLSEMEDDSLFQLLLPIGKRLMTTSIELDEFVTNERDIAEKAEEHQTLRYWVALSGRAESVSEKVSLPFSIIFSLRLRQFLPELSRGKQLIPIFGRLFILIVLLFTFLRLNYVLQQLRHLLPGSVAARIIIDILEDSGTEWRMREKTLQLANSKLIHDGFFFSESGINEEHLEKMILVLNKWITKERLDHEKVTFNSPYLSS
ncbi:unnamed protein product [Angiostrongylus costaricensis]|uniref:HEAT repeat-containing protein 1 n=1 Tax=Angiostrongylus costaricensis TaxID=334426 RepID=A0A158PGP3_ANGCS|nr:unnamed protein product [Angiostrongylus costaricensis]